MDAGVHRLPAWDNDYVTQTIKKLAKTDSRRHCHYGDIDLRYSRPLHLDEFLVLVIHVVDGYLVQLAQLCGIFQNFTWFEAVDMDPDQGFVAGNY
jgi:hypothetical protein